MRTMAMMAVSGALMLTACGGNDTSGGLTAEENRRLDNAAEMLDTETAIPSPDAPLDGEDYDPADDAATGDVLVSGNDVTE